MADLDNILIFVKVAQFESITRAARSLGMPISTVSRRLSVLESELGVSLLRRTTRRVTLTAQGRAYFSQCQEPLNLLQEAEQVLTRAQRRPEGLLRITVPVIVLQEPFFDFMGQGELRGSGSGLKHDAVNETALNAARGERANAFHQ